MTAKTVEEAKEAALYQLGVAEGDAELIVISEPKSGLFGRVRGEARVRARVRPVGPRPKRQRHGSRDRTRSSGAGRGGRQGGGSRSGESARQGAAEGEQPSGESPARSSGSGGGKSRSARRRRSRSGASSGAGASAGENGSARGRGGESDNGRAGRGGRGPEGQKATEEAEMAEGMTLEEQAEVAKEFLEGLLDIYGFEGTVRTRVIDEETVEVAADGEGLGLLVGPKGSTLAALQDVTRTVVQRRCPSRTDRILVDVAGYREKRSAALQRFSQQVAADVIESGNERALEPMSPADRKVVHDAINEIDGVVTRSDGEDANRHVVIAPG